MQPPPTIDRHELDQAIERWRRREGGNDSFRPIVEAFYRPVYGFFRRRGVDAESSHDLTQETFVRIHTHLDGFRDDSSFETWAFTIAANVWRKAGRDGRALKRGGGVEPESLEETPREPTAEHADPLEHAIRRQQTERLRQALERLPPKMRAVLELHLYQDRSRREIAQALGISIETVKAHLLQARRKLADAVAGAPAGQAPASDAPATDAPATDASASDASAAPSSAAMQGRES